MRSILYCLLIALFALNTLSQAVPSVPEEVTKQQAQSRKGFAYPYYLYVPKRLREEGAAKTHTILVIPNNTGKIDDDLAVHDENAKRRVVQNGTLTSKLGVIVLMPVFPRPKSDWKIYTHALDRDSMLTDKAEYRRFDLQLAAMIDDAREKFAGDGLQTDKQVLMLGFSASGMFVNRFTFLHPGRVKAAAIGSPGGWPIAPVAVYGQKRLRYPVGTGDIQSIGGSKLDVKDLRRVPLFIFLGDKDDNDSVIFGDGYDAEDKDLIFELFGKTPVERWEISKTLYSNAKLQAEFKLYPNVAHTVTPEMAGDILAFFKKYVR